LLRLRNCSRCRRGWSRSSRRWCSQRWAGPRGGGRAWASWWSRCSSNW